MINIEKSKEEKKKFNKKLLKDIITNFVYAMIISIYLICFNLQYEWIEPNLLQYYINISSIMFLSLAITMLEIAYRKDKIKIFGHGIEYILLATFTILIKHVPKMMKCNIEQYIKSGICVVVVYYVLKIILLYTKYKQDELKSLSDIKEIVKEEPIKKEAKRKNKKEEEGK